jgi:DNA-binding NarL/FixJ family response regulator
VRFRHIYARLQWFNPVAAVSQFPQTDRGLVPLKRLLLVDDNPAILETLAEMLQPEFTVVGTLSHGGSVLAKAAALDPDIILLDVSLPDMTGFEVAEALGRGKNRARIIFLSVHENPDFVRAAFESGASGYVFKSQISRDLINAIEGVARGEQFNPISYIISPD